MKVIVTIVSFVFLHIMYGQNKYVQLSGNVGSGKTYVGLTFELENSKSFLLFGGVQVGNFGKRTFLAFDDATKSSLIISPYAIWEDTVNQADFGYVYRQKEYTSSNKGMAFNIGIGKRLTLEDGKNELDIKYLFSYYFVEDSHSHVYEDFFTKTLPSYTSNYKTKHESYSNALSFGYNRKLSNKLYLTSGVQFLYFVPIHNDKYKPFDQRQRDLMVGIEHNFLIGLKYKL